VGEMSQQLPAGTEYFFRSDVLESMGLPGRSGMAFSEEFLPAR